MEQITISVSNKELNALEQLLTVKLSEKDYEARRKTCIKLWGKLVKEFDKPKINIEYLYRYFVSYSHSGGGYGNAVIVRDREILGIEDTKEMAIKISDLVKAGQIVVLNYILIGKTPKQ